MSKKYGNAKKVTYVAQPLAINIHAHRMKTAFVALYSSLVIGGIIFCKLSPRTP